MIMASSDMVLPQLPSSHWWINANHGNAFNSISSTPNGVNKLKAIGSATSVSTGHTDLEGRSRSISIPLQAAMDKLQNGDEKWDEVNASLEVKAFEMLSLIRSSRTTSKSNDDPLNTKAVPELSNLNSNSQFEYYEEEEAVFDDDIMTGRDSASNQEYLVGESFEQYEDEEDQHAQNEDGPRQPMMERESYYRVAHHSQQHHQQPLPSHHHYNGMRYSPGDKPYYHQNQAAVITSSSAESSSAALNTTMSAAEDDNKEGEEEIFTIDL